MAEPLPFEEVFRPLVVDAVTEARGTIDPSAWSLLSPEAHADWARFLLSRISRVGSKAAHWQFEIHKSVQAVFPTERGGARNAPDASYRRFVSSEPKSRLRKLFDEFPGLAELCAVLVENWCATVSEFLARLQADRIEFNSRFASADFTSPVSGLQAGLGDPHNGGRCVVRLNFVSGVSLIYKPRSLAPEAHFEMLLDHLNAVGIPHTFYSAHSWDRGRYGWMENVEAKPCKTIADVHAFYWRAGALLGVVHLARGVDFHQENLVAFGGHPVLIDLETLWHPQEFAEEERPCTNFELLRTGFLPRGKTETGVFYAWSALSSIENLESICSGWTHVNQDNMAWKTGKQELRRRQNLPVQGERTHMANDFTEDVQAGYRWVGDQMLDGGRQRDEFALWLRTLMRCPRRLVRRSTIHYRSVAERLVSPELLRNGQRPGSWRAEICRNLVPVSETEIRALMQGDIPCFEQTDNESERPENFASVLPTKTQFSEGLSEIEAAFLSEP